MWQVPPFLKGGKGDFLELAIWILPFDVAQGGELVEPLLFVFWSLEFFIFKDATVIRYAGRFF